MELFKGVATALITPFRGGKIDADALDLLLDRQAAAGIPAVVMAGTTGESPALTYGEFDELLRRARARWRGTLIAGCGANCTDRAAELAKIARDAGADALLAVTPYYNKASRAGLTTHYRAICAAGLPTVVYHVPSRTGQRLSIGDFGALAGVDGICGVKECSGDLAFLRELALTFASLRVVRHTTHSPVLSMISCEYLSFRMEKESITGSEQTVPAQAAVITFARPSSSAQQIRTAGTG